MEDLPEDLLCPITREPLVDPIIVPCCTKAFSRASLITWFERSRICPHCNGNLQDFDVSTAPKNLAIAGTIESLLKLRPVAASVVKWSATLTKIQEPIAQLEISLENSKFVTKPSLFIAVVDFSGSMSGSPARQVTAALIHIIGLTNSNPMVKTVIAPYASASCVIPFTIEAVQSLSGANTFGLGGGTNFSAAFGCVKDILKDYVYSEEQSAPNSISNVIISFLTDGETGEKDLVNIFRQLLQDSWAGPVSVHAIGFGANCDKVLLEGLRQTGTIPGTFRYTEPGENEDSLCNKLTSLFDVAAQASVVPITLASNSLHLKSGNEFIALGTPRNIQFPLNRKNNGSFKTWVRFPNDHEAVEVLLNSPLDKDLQIPVAVKTDQKSVARAAQEWISSVVDDIASETLALSGSQTEKGDVFDLHCALINQKIDALLSQTSDANTVERLTFLSGQVKSMRKGLAINIGKLSDLRFGSQFSGGPAAKPAMNVAVTPIDHSITNGPEGVNQIANVSAWKERTVRYSRNNKDTNRDALQSAIMDNIYNSLTAETERCFGGSNLLYQDVHGNTALHLAAYSGQIETTERLVKMCKDAALIENKDGELPITLAIKKRGFHRTVGVLLDAGLKIPGNRLKGLERYAFDNNFTITAQILSSLGQDETTIDSTMKPEYIRFMFKRLTDAGKPFDVQCYLKVCLEKCLVDLVKKLIKDYGAKPTFQMFLEYCIPKKADDPETPVYIELADLVLNLCPEFIHMSDAETKESCVFVAARNGSLPHVKFFLDKGASIDQPNVLDNSPLWIACAKRYPCIIGELLSRGADVNRTNCNGNPPMYSVCQRGPKKIAEQLLSAGATLTHINHNGDTLILLCCRNGQPDILSLFLDYVDPEFVNRKAHIDGFNAIFSSVEANKPECITILKDYGIDIEQRTADDNAILPGATPLHLAAYYCRVEAAQRLLQLGANPNSIDSINGQTPLHIAVTQGHIPLITLLRNAKADISIQDRTGNTCSAYCRNRTEIREVLIDPALDVFMKLGKGQFSKAEQKLACDVVAKFSGIIGCFSQRNSLDIRAADGSTMFMQAVIYSNFDVANTLHELNVDTSVKNSMGVSCAVFANWINNPRIKALIPGMTDEDRLCLKRLQQNSLISPADGQIMFLGKLLQQRPTLASGITHRMNNIAVAATVPQAVPPEKNDQHVWNAKLHIFGLIATGQNELVGFSPTELFGLCYYSNNDFVSKELNHVIQSGPPESIIGTNRQRLKVLLGAMDKLPPYVGECFIGTDLIADRSKFQIGTVVSFASFLSASTLWRVAVENTPEFSTKKREGIIFIVKSKTGRFIGQYSEFSFDCEVLFRPYTKFKVTNWYHGDVFALAQANIREHTFKVRSESDKTAAVGVIVGKNHNCDPLEVMIQNKKSLIIELEETPNEIKFIL